MQIDRFRETFDPDYIMDLIEWGAQMGRQVAISTEGQTHNEKVGKILCRYSPIDYPKIFHSVDLTKDEHGQVPVSELDDYILDEWEESLERDYHRSQEKKEALQDFRSDDGVTSRE